MSNPISPSAEDAIAPHNEGVYAIIAPEGTTHTARTLYSMVRLANVLIGEYCQNDEGKAISFVVVKPDGISHRATSRRGMVMVIRKIIREYFGQHPNEVKPEFMEKRRIDRAFKWVSVYPDGRIMFKRPIFAAVPNPNPLDVNLPDKQAEIYEKHLLQNPMREPIAGEYNRKSSGEKSGWCRQEEMTLTQS